VFRVLAIAATLCLQILPAAIAADLAPVPPGPHDRELTRSYIEGRAVLLIIRSSFGVLESHDVEATLVDDAERVARDGPSEAQLEELEMNLLTEGSYYLVSLEYTIRAGGAAWPADRPEVHYENDALALLDGLKRRLLDAVETRTDTLPIVIEGQRLMALTNGEKEIPPADDLFGRRDAMVKRVLERVVPWTST